MKVKELKYPDECANCKTDACSICEHRQKRSDTIDRYYKQFERIANIRTKRQMIIKINNEIKNMIDQDVIILLSNIRFTMTLEILKLEGNCKLCGKQIHGVTKYPDEFDDNLCADCNIEYVV